MEAVFEDLAVKQEVFQRIDKLARPGALLASNTSYLDLDGIAGATQRPRDVVGLHFFSPAHVMRLMEVVRGTESSQQSLATAFVLAQRFCKLPVLTRNAFGFIGNPLITTAGLDHTPAALALVANPHFISARRSAPCAAKVILSMGVGRK
jgi:3-hydroxyacyl-CoA dehydrogenase